MSLAKPKYVLFSWFFATTLLLSSFQVTISGFQSEENSVFSLLVELAEEESEEAESEIGKKLNETTSLASNSLEFINLTVEQLASWAMCAGLGSGHIQLNSPPPEVMA